ncbi:MAG TPA: carboxypeptidase regulatory-like domain-containing protein [Pyrinomonadaceae bacterium]|nr:carboxypeptidase regulatory-like domain-containing protein [Pyrinomonadaceae bacterium]
MFSFSKDKLLKPFLVALTAIFVSSGFVLETQAKAVVKNNGKLGVIKGVVRDASGKPIADAFVAVFYVGTSKLLKQVRSASDGSFLAKVMPGTYTILAVAQGYNPITLSEVEVNHSAELVYRFKLEPAGSGNTLPEKLVDRDNPKWRIRSAHSRRSVYQNTEGEPPVDENATAENVEESLEIADEEEKFRGKGQTVVETYVASSEDGAYTGVNFATVLPINENTEIVLAGQTGMGENAPTRFETNLKFRPNDKHQIRINGAIAKFGNIEISGQEESLGQVSFQALDEWRVREGIVLVFGFDYSRFIGAGDDFSLSPRLGFQFDVNSKTRFRSAYTTQTEKQSWQRVIELEDTQVLFREPVAMQDFAVENDKPLMNKTSRLEFGIERVLDNKSTVEANVFLDAVSARGVGLINLPLNSLTGDGFGDFVANQQGRAQGIRVVYNRRLNGMFSTAAGYSFGNGQKLSNEGISNPADVFEEDFFQTFFGQFDATLRTGTKVKTIFRFSPQAAVFAIDPFQGRLAIYDPSLSILVTQSLPTLGLPIRAEAVVDARNLFDFNTGVEGEEGSLRLNSGRRMLRGGISVRF